MKTNKHLIRAIAFNDIQTLEQFNKSGMQLSDMYAAWHYLSDNENVIKSKHTSIGQTWLCLPPPPIKEIKETIAEAYKCALSGDYSKASDNSLTNMCKCLHLIDELDKSGEKHLLDKYRNDEQLEDILKHSIQ
jgi:hypothetical protein